MNAELEAGDTKNTLLNRARLKELIGTTEKVTDEQQDAKIALAFCINNGDEAIASILKSGTYRTELPLDFLVKFTEVTLSEGVIVP